MPFTRNFTAQPDDIDALGHVNNAVWVRSQSVGKSVLANGIVGGFKHRRFVYEWLVYIVAFHCVEYLGSVYASGGI